MTDRVERNLGMRNAADKQKQASERESERENAQRGAPSLAARPPIRLGEVGENGGEIANAAPWLK